MARYNLAVSDTLDKEIEQIAVEMDTSRSEVLRKAITLLIAAHKGAKEGKRVGLADPGTRQLTTEFIGL